MHEIVSAIENMEWLVEERLQSTHVRWFSFRITDHIICTVHHGKFSPESNFARVHLVHNPQDRTVDAVKRYGLNVVDVVSRFGINTMWPRNMEKSMSRGVTASLGLMLSVFLPSYVRTLPVTLPIGDVDKLEVLLVYAAEELPEWRRQYMRACKVVPQLHDAELVLGTLQEKQCVRACELCLEEMASFGYQSAAGLLQEIVHTATAHS